MNIVRKDLDPTNANITISIENQIMKQSDKTLREYRKKSNIPVFVRAWFRLTCSKMCMANPF